MPSECDEITAALRKATGAGAQRLRDLALTTLETAGVGADFEPRRIAAALGYRMQPVISVLRRTVPRARVEGRRIWYRFDEESREWGMSALLGISAVRLAELGVVAGKADCFRFAAHLALPDRDSELAEDLETQLYLPRWLIVAHHETRASLAAASALRLVVAR
jgi:hypothetical protein